MEVVCVRREGQPLTLPQSLSITQPTNALSSNPLFWEGFPAEFCWHSSHHTFGDKSRPIPPI